MYRCQNEEDRLIEISPIDNMLFFAGLCYYIFLCFWSDLINLS